ncbi:MAG: hypothetical protein J7K26_01325 [Candidatus Aenigmarchaeota archaeon]|nr:hypothetical protein [Candidatus Aenigmarchaeota archaeon]
MEMALLILDKNASIEDMIKAYHGVNQEIREKYGSQSITVLANDEAMQGNERHFSEQANIIFLPDWQINASYRNMLRQALGSENIYIMKKDGDCWKYVKASKDDYEVLDLDGNINIKPKNH